MVENNNEISDITEYAEEYHTQKAIEEADSLEFTWLVHSMSVGVDKSVLHIDVRANGELAVLILNGKQLGFFCKEYPQVFDYCSPSETSISFPLDIHRDKDNVSIPGIPDSVKLLEPDLAIVETDAKLTSDSSAVEQKLKRHEWLYDYAKQLKNEGVKIEVASKVKNGKLVVESLTPPFEEYPWKYKPPDNIDAATTNLIEAAGGDPRFIDGMSMYILPDELCKNTSQVCVNKLGFALVPRQLYKKWNVNPNSSSKSLFNKLIFWD